MKHGRNFHHHFSVIRNGYCSIFVHVLYCTATAFLFCAHFLTIMCMYKVLTFGPVTAIVAFLQPWLGYWQPYKWELCSQLIIHVQVQWYWSVMLIESSCSDMLENRVLLSFFLSVIGLQNKNISVLINSLTGSGCICLWLSCAHFILCILCT